MKKIFVLSLVLLSMVSKAEEQLMSDKGSAKLASALAGHKLLCGPVDDDSAKAQETGFFPLTVSAVDKGAGKTQLSVETKDAKVGFGYGGSEFDNTEFSGTWFIISNGDDGRRHLFVESFDAKNVGDYKCPANQGDQIDGQLAGIVTEIWDAGHISSHGVQCCIE